MNWNLFISPHHDDETLFGAFTLIAEKPNVCICFPSAGDYGSTDDRLAETRAAIEILGAGSVAQLSGKDLAGAFRGYDEGYRPRRVWAPDVDSSHPQHVEAALAARAVFGDRVTTYHTYRDGVRVVSEREVPFVPQWVELKLRALACYRSQMSHPRAYQFFMQNQREYYGVER